MPRVLGTVRALVLLFCATAAAQPVAFGLKGGLRPTPDQTDYGIFGHPESRPYLVGAFGELRLPLRFAVEVDALYSRIGRTDLYPGIGNEAWLRTRANAWEFPLLVKYRLPRGFFAAGGFVPRYASGKLDVTGYHMVTISTESTYHDVTYWSAHDHAWTAGGGWEFRAGPVRIAPEVRYLRWRVVTLAQDWRLESHVPLLPNEAQILLSVGWGGR